MGISEGTNKFNRRACLELLAEGVVRMDLVTGQGDEAEVAVKVLDGLHFLCTQLEVEYLSVVRR